MPRSLQLIWLLAFALHITTAYTASILDQVPDVVEGEEEEEEEAEAVAVERPDERYDGDDLVEMMMGGGGGSMLSTQHLEQLFAQLDKNGDSLVNATEISSAFDDQRSLRMEQVRAINAEEAERILQDADGNSDGVLSLDEFSEAELPQSSTSELPVQELFAFADSGADGKQAADGRLSAEELPTALFPEASARRAAYQELVARRVIARYDVDADGRLGASELMRLTMAVQGLAPDTEEGEELRLSMARQGETEAELSQYVAAEAQAQLDMYDADRDGTLDAVELGEQLVPSPAHVDEYAQDAVQQLVSSVPEGGGYTFEAVSRSAMLFANAFGQLLEPTQYEDGYFDAMAYEGQAFAYDE